ncbi:MAG: kinase [Alphaproteobacteria bacterium]|nr:kinase [Alphaproteobacteria bacterium]
MSFFGGGTDYPTWYRREGGAVLSTSVDKYCYVMCRWLPPFFPSRHRVVWSHIELVSTISEILHPAVRNGLQMLNFDDSRGIEIHHQGDLPARAGMGSSSAFAVGLLHVLQAMRGEAVDKKALYEQAIALEQDWIKDKVGSQDQVACAMGGLNIIHFQPDGSIRAEPLGLSDERREALNSRMMLFYTGTSRLASEVAAQVIADLEKRQTTLRQMHSLVFDAAALLRSDRDLDEFGRMLHETWKAKRSLSSVISNDRIDQIYETARQAGALGGKLLGAGSSGFMVFYVPHEAQDRVRAALGSLLDVPFKFDRAGTVLLESSGRV